MAGGVLKGTLIAMAVCAGPALLFLIGALIWDAYQYHLRGDKEFNNRE